MSGDWYPRTGVYPPIAVTEYASKGFTYLVSREEDSAGNFMCYVVTDRKGAILTTETDETKGDVAIQAALDRGAAKVLLSEGRHKWSSAPTYSDNQTIEGMGLSTIIELQANIVPFSLHNIKRTHIRNLDVEVTDGHTEAILEMLADGSSQVEYCSYENINIHNSYTTHAFTGIRLSINGDRHIQGNQFRQIYMDQCNKGIHIQGLSDSAWANDNLFEKVWAGGYEILVHFDGTATKTDLANVNTFIAVTGETQSYSTDGFKGVFRHSNVFLNCHPWDWGNASAPNYIWSVDSDATATVIIDPLAGSPWHPANISDQAHDTTWLTDQTSYIQYHNLRTVGTTSGTSSLNYEKLSACLADITDAAANNRYVVYVFGKITDDVQIAGKSYVDVIGYNAEIENTVDDSSVSLANITNSRWNNLTIKSTGSKSGATAALRGQSIDDTVKLYDCNFINDGTGTSLAAGIMIASNANAEFYNCYGKGSTAGASGYCMGWLFSGDSEAPRLISCKGEGANSSLAFSFTHTATPSLIDCTALQMSQFSGTRGSGYCIDEGSAPTIKNCAAMPQEYTYSWDYTNGATNGQFRPFSNHPYQLIAARVMVDTAHSATLDLGTSVGGTEIASGIDISSTGEKYFDINREEVAANGYMYATPSVAISAGDITVDYTVVYNYGNNYGLYIDTKGYANISNSSFYSNGASDACYINETSVKNWKANNCVFETYDPVNQSAVNAATSITGENIQGCSFVGNMTNVTGIDNKAKGQETFSGDGATTAFSWVHGLSTTPSSVIVTAASADANGAYYVTGDVTNITVTFATAPVSGTNNVMLNWFAEV